MFLLLNQFNVLLIELTQVVCQLLELALGDTNRDRLGMCGLEPKLVANDLLLGIRKVDYKLLVPLNEHSQHLGVLDGESRGVNLILRIQLGVLGDLGADGVFQVTVPVIPVHTAIRAREDGLHSLLEQGVLLLGLKDQFVQPCFYLPREICLSMDHSNLYLGVLEEVILDD